MPGSLKTVAFSQLWQDLALALLSITMRCSPTASKRTLAWLRIATI